MMATINLLYQKIAKEQLSGFYSRRCGSKAKDQDSLLRVPILQFCGFCDAIAITELYAENRARKTKPTRHL